jgi:ribose transport system substrate-binding protein
MQSTRSRSLLLGCVATLAGTWLTQAQAKDTVTISLIQAMSGNEWATEVLAGANAAAKDLGGKVHIRVSGPPAIDPPKQAQMFLSELDTSPDILIVVNIAPPLFTQPAAEAEAKGAKVVWINVPPTPEVKNALLISADAYDMGLHGGAIVGAALEKSLNKPAAEIVGDVPTGICVVGLTVVENRLAGHAAYLKERFPKINILPKFKSESDRTRNFAIWDEAIRAKPKAITYIDPCEQGEENIPKILEADNIKAPFVSYDTPEEIRDDIAKGTVTAAIPSNFFMQAYLAVYVAGGAALNGKPLPHGWLKAPTVTIDQTNIAEYSKAWKDPETGLRAFYGAQIDAIKDHIPADLPDPDSFNHPTR